MTESHHKHARPITRSHPSTRSEEKAQTFALHFAEKKTALDSESLAPFLLQRTIKKLSRFNIQLLNVESIPTKNVDRNTDPDGVSPYLLHPCAAEVALPLTLIITVPLRYMLAYLEIWKIVPIHKKVFKIETKKNIARFLFCQ